MRKAREQLAVGSWRLVVAISLLFSACGTYVPVAGGDNFAYLYGKGAAAMRLQARVYHASDKRSVIWFKLRTEDLLYKNSGGGGSFRARVQLKYEAYSSWDSETLLDSASTFVKDSSEQPNEKKDLIGSIDMKRNEQRSFLLKVTVRDMNRNSESTVFIPVEQGAPGQRQGFLPVTEKGIPLFDDRVFAGTQVRVLCEQYANTTLYAEHLETPAKLPAPVFTQTDIRPVVKVDSTYEVQVGPDGYFTFKAGSSGFDHFRVDTSSMVGFTVFASPGTFPEVDQVSDMVAPLRYITSLQEWDRLSATINKRKEVEKFWIDAAGSRDRAREAIDAYYSRVESANRHFTSYTDGWKTDRGLVHIIFGTPNMIRRTATSETWTYGEESNLMSLTFTFEKRDGPYSNNDMVLRRDGIFKTAWYRNVESWRNGRIVQN
ncbi:MAG: GWxTD domain-containing protein [Flavobacteriales bacterium]|nr:GWxTD domain-containing protein [Flavobacteriales bacterium]MBL0043632.1 GWxTD domain-containing protein [Flavobacteriales bacterium]